MWPSPRGRLRRLALLFLLGVASAYAAVGYATEQAGLGVEEPPRVTQLARSHIPTGYLKLYRSAGRRYGIPWTVLAAIGKVESDHGRSSAPGVRSGVNRFGCCAGPMQFNIRNGPRTTWDRYGRGNVYSPSDAIPAAARLLKANGAPGNLRRAIWHYNHAGWYVRDVLAWSDRYKRGHL
jgi:hypothetical protein